MKSKSKLKLFEQMNKGSHPLLWVHPLSIPFVRSNYPTLPIACAIGNMRWWVLNGNDSFYFKNDKYASYKVMLKTEDQIRDDLELHDFRDKNIRLYYNSNSYAFFPDSIYDKPRLWDEMANDLSVLYAHDGMSIFLKGKEDWDWSIGPYGYGRSKPRAERRPSYFCSHGSAIRVNGVEGKLVYPSTYKLNEKGEHKNLKIRDDEGNVYDIYESEIERII